MIKGVSCCIFFAQDGRNWPWDSWPWEKWSRDCQVLGRSGLGTIESSGMVRWYFEEMSCWHILLSVFEKVLVRRDTCHDPGANQNLTTKMSPSLPLSLGSREKKWSGSIHLLTWEVEVSLVLWKTWSRCLFTSWAFLKIGVGVDSWWI